MSTLGEPLETETSEEFGFKLLGQKSILGLCSEKYPYASLQLLDICNEAKLYAASNGNDAIIGRLQNLRDFVTGGKESLETLWSDTLQDIINVEVDQNGATFLSKSGDLTVVSVQDGISSVNKTILIEGEILLAKALRNGQWLILNTSGTLLYFQGKENSTCKLKTQVSSFDVNLSTGEVVTLDKDGNIYISQLETNATQNSIRIPSQIKDELSDDFGPLGIYILSADQLLLVIGNKPLEDTQDDVIYDQKMFIICKDNCKNPEFHETFDLTPAFGTLARYPSHYNISFQDLIAGSETINILSSACSSELSLWDSINIIQPSQDSARVVLPISNTTDKDTTPVGFSLDLSSEGTINEPCPGVDSIQSLPLLYLLNNEGDVLITAFYHSGAIKNGTFSVETTESLLQNTFTGDVMCIVEKCNEENSDCRQILDDDKIRKPSKDPLVNVNSDTSSFISNVSKLEVDSSTKEPTSGKQDKSIDTIFGGAVDSFSNMSFSSFAVDKNTDILKDSFKTSTETSAFGKPNFGQNNQLGSKYTGSSNESAFGKPSFGITSFGVQKSPQNECSSRVDDEPATTTSAFGKPVFGSLMTSFDTLNTISTKREGFQSQQLSPRKDDQAEVTQSHIDSKNMPSMSQKIPENTLDGVASPFGNLSVSTPDTDDVKATQNDNSLNSGKSSGPNLANISDNGDGRSNVFGKPAFAQINTVPKKEISGAAFGQSSFASTTDNSGSIFGAPSFGSNSLASNSEGSNQMEPTVPSIGASGFSNLNKFSSNLTDSGTHSGFAAFAKPSFGKSPFSSLGKSPDQTRKPDIFGIPSSSSQMHSGDGTVHDESPKEVQDNPTSKYEHNLPSVDKSPFGKPIFGQASNSHVGGAVFGSSAFEVPKENPFAKFGSKKESPFASLVKKSNSITDDKNVSLESNTKEGFPTYNDNKAGSVDEKIESSRSLEDLQVDSRNESGDTNSSPNIEGSSQLDLEESSSSNSRIFEKKNETMGIATLTNKIKQSANIEFPSTEISDFKFSKSPVEQRKESPFAGFVENLNKPASPAFLFKKLESNYDSSKKDTTKLEILKGSPMIEEAGKKNKSNIESNDKESCAISDKDLEGEIILKDEEQEYDGDEDEVDEEEEAEQEGDRHGRKYTSKEVPPSNGVVLDHKNSGKNNGTVADSDELHQSDSTTNSLNLDKDNKAAARSVSRTDETEFKVPESGSSIDPDPNMSEQQLDGNVKPPDRYIVHTPGEKGSNECSSSDDNVFGKQKVSKGDNLVAENIKSPFTADSDNLGNKQDKQTTENTDVSKSLTTETDSSLETSKECNISREAVLPVQDHESTSIETCKPKHLQNYYSGPELTNLPKLSDNGTMRAIEMTYYSISSEIEVLDDNLSNFKLYVEDQNQDPNIKRTPNSISNLYSWRLSEYDRFIHILNEDTHNWTDEYTYIKRIGDDIQKFISTDFEHVLTMKDSIKQQLDQSETLLNDMDLKYRELSMYQLRIRNELRRKMVKIGDILEHVRCAIEVFMLYKSKKRSVEDTELLRNLIYDSTSRFDLLEEIKMLRQEVATLNAKTNTTESTQEAQLGRTAAVSLGCSKIVETGLVLDTRKQIGEYFKAQY